MHTQRFLAVTAVACLFSWLPGGPIPGSSVSDQDRRLADAAVEGNNDPSVEGTRRCTVSLATVNLTEDDQRRAINRYPLLTEQDMRRGNYRTALLTERDLRRAEWRFATALGSASH